AGFRQARWVNVGGHRVDYEWDEDAGWKGLERALKTAETATSHPSGRLSAMIVPAQADTCTPELLQTAYREAEKRDLPFQTHAAQTMVEFHEILRRHGLSPVQWLDSLGVLSGRTILGHCIYLDGHSWSPLRTSDDLPLLADRGVTVAHCPTVFGRTGMTLESAGGYIRGGVQLGMGTDSFPFNMLEELRHAAVYSRITAGDVFDVSTGDLFHAATAGGAQALRRSDIGRLDPGARADIVVVDTSHPLMQPLHDPLRSLIYVAADRAVRDVFVDGRQVVSEGTVATMDYAAAVAEEKKAQRRAVDRVPDADRAKRNLEELAPLCLETLHNGSEPGERGSTKN
ncbi:MAG: amidohydrolase family protein, partial [Spirochaetia bacterium]